MKTVGIIAGALAVIVAAVFYAIVQPGGTGVVASIQLPDGSRYMVTQRCNWSAEPYTVSFYMCSPGGEWGWCYIDHQAIRWRNVAMRYDPASDVVTITARGTWKAALDRRRKTFAIGNGKPSREVDAPQGYHEPEFPFPQAD